MSSPWCHPPGTSARGAPNVSPYPEGPYTGKTYPPDVIVFWTGGGRTSFGKRPRSSSTFDGFFGAAVDGVAEVVGGGGGDGGAGGGGGGSALTGVDASTSAYPTRILVPTGSPPWSASSQTSRPVTQAW